MLLFKPLMGVLVGLALQPVCNLAVGIFIGGFTVNTIFVGLIASGLPDTFQDVALGIFLLIVMLFSENKDTIAKRFRRKSEIVIDSKGT
jgi:ribose transport system permease protein